MNRENDSLHNWLVFSKSEKRGITILLILVGIFITIRYIQKSKIGHKTSVIAIQSEVPSKNELRSQNNSIWTTDSLSSNFSTSYSAHSEIFDPNDATVEDLIDQGIPTHIANRIINYRLKGGVFYKAADLYKIYGIDSFLVTELLPWIVIKATRPPGQMHTPSSAISNPAKSKVLIEINSVDSSVFCLLPGIGQVLSRRIIRYREILGGFHAIEQLNEVYGIDDSLFTSIAGHLIVDTSMINKLALNSADFNELKSHPYLSNYEAKSILSYRKLIGPFTAYNELVENYILSENTYQKVRSYLSLN